MPVVWVECKLYVSHLSSRMATFVAGPKTPYQEEGGREFLKQAGLRLRCDFKTQV
jgi:hypothetical protein